MDVRIPGPHTLARALRRAPPLPTGVVHLLGSLEVELAFRELVQAARSVDPNADLAAIPLIGELISSMKDA